MMKDVIQLVCSAGVCIAVILICCGVKSFCYKILKRSEHHDDQ